MEQKILFPKELVNELIVYFAGKGYSYREIREIFKEVKKYTCPSLGYISKILKKSKKK